MGNWSVDLRGMGLKGGRGIPGGLGRRVDIFFSLPFAGPFEIWEIDVLSANSLLARLRAAAALACALCIVLELSPRNIETLLPSARFRSLRLIPLCVFCFSYILNA